MLYRAELVSLEHDRPGLEFVRQASGVFIYNVSCIAGAESRIYVTEDHASCRKSALRGA